ncbi:hypothetical protein [uncultured Lacinutrix sp.]|uniref:hypothetical protein n=1 Tax=uncultured Lacinutrix sp. TaxID=574032 RepID=UPI002622FB10|nr:hypothetical protein [uncultured Lacinutrix sp.]
MNNEWKHFKTVADGEYCGIDGINIWDYEWKSDYETIIVKASLYGETKSLNRFWIELPNRKVEFVAGEFSMCVWGIYTQKNDRIENKNSLKIKSKIAREITNEFDLLGLIANGAPEDEYDSFSARILSDIINKKGNKEIVENAFVLLTYYYGAETVESKITNFKAEIEKLSEKIREKTYANIV